MGTDGTEERPNVRLLKVTETKESTDDSQSVSLVTASPTGAGDTSELFDDIILKKEENAQDSLYRYLKTTQIAFYVLMVFSFAALIAYQVVWINISNSRNFVNMFTAFTGITVATAFNIFGSLFGLSSMKEKHSSESGLYNHCSAVRWLLVTGLIFNIACPTCGLQPLESDLLSKIPRMSLIDCTKEGLPLSLRHQCVNASALKKTVGSMYILLPLEIFVIVMYSLWMRKAQANLLNNPDQRMEMRASESISESRLAIRGISEHTALESIT